MDRVVGGNMEEGWIDKVVNRKTKRQVDRVVGGKIKGQIECWVKRWTDR